MPRVLTDKHLIEEFLERGVEKIYPSKDLLRQKLLSGERIKAYQGFDPTGPHLHIGHAMGIRSLGILQKLGHEVIFLVGDYTAKVGDPDKDTGRELLSDETINKNLQGWKEQASQLIDFEGENPVKFMHNFDWLSKLTLNDLIELMSKATVQQMLERDLFQRRITQNNPIGLQEFIYPLMQGFDSVAMQVDLEIGGTDQTFNMLMGRQLVKEYLGKEKFVRAYAMMDAPDRLTMSKTKGNGINLADSPENMYGKAMSYPDELIIKALTLLTELPLDQIAEIDAQIKSGENPMTFKKIMAYEIVRLVKGEEAASSSQKHFEDTVQRKEVNDNLVSMTDVNGKMTVWEFLKKTDTSGTSSSELKRLIEQGGVEVNKKKVTNPMEEIDFSTDTEIKKGKRTFIRVK
jgi:tyrosyl-tRNA synthetase